MRLVLLFLFSVFCVSVSVQAQDKESTEGLRLKKLSALHKLNVQADIYLSYCDRQNTLQLGRFYVANLEATKYHLSRALAESRSDGNVEKAKRDVDLRAQEIAGSAHYEFRSNGCDTKKAMSARAHAQKIGRPKLTEFLQYLRNIESR